MRRFEVSDAFFTGGTRNPFFKACIGKLGVTATSQNSSPQSIQSMKYFRKYSLSMVLLCRLADMNDDGVSYIFTYISFQFLRHSKSNQIDNINFQILDIVVTMDNRRDNSGTLAILYSDGIGGADLRIISDDLLLGFSTLEIADLDGDFHNDIAVLAQDRDALFVFFSNVNADSKFDVEVIDLQLDGVSGAMAIGHLRSGSSLPDIITVSNKGLNIYQNQGGREFSKDAIFEDGFLPVGSSLRADIYDLDGKFKR